MTNLDGIIAAGNGRRMVLLEITPSVAEQLLERNTRNRPLKESTIKRYTKDLREGLWRSTAQPIVVDWNGDLLDGQHRLWACVSSGIPFTAYIALGEDPDTFSAYDRGTKRTAGDSLALLDYKNANILAAAANKLHRYRRGLLWSTTAADRYVNVEDTVRIVREFPGLVDSVNASRKGTNIRTILAPSLGAFLHYLFTEVDADAAEEFFDKLDSGEGLSRTDGVFHLRDRLIRNRMDTKAKLSEKEIAALTIKAWNRRGEEVRALRWRSVEPAAEPFPEIR